MTFYLLFKEVDDLCFSLSYSYYIISRRCYFKVAKMKVHNSKPAESACAIHQTPVRHFCYTAVEFA